jgi:acyl-CoA reductase-like NAD-dependent aldehyde dehydrogenase
VSDTLVQNYVNGKLVDSAATEFTELVDPATGRVTGRSPESTPDEVDEAVRAAEAAFATWRRTTPSHRQQALLKLADAIEEHNDELVERQSRNTGQIKALIASDEVKVGADQLRFFACAARNLEGKATGEYMDGLSSSVRREPIGVVAQVTPWNYPLMMALWNIGPAIAAGQDCTAATRVIVAEQIHDRFVEALVAKAKETRPGDRDDEDAAYGPLTNANHFAKVCAIIAKLPDHATAVTGGRQFGTEGFFFEPTVITGLEQNDQAIQEEIFGPVITVQPFQDEADALAKANDVPYGLSSSVWTKDHATALRMSRDLDFCCVWINTHIPLAAEMPPGGFGQSGYGKDLSGYELEDHTRVKHVMSSLD